MFLVMRSYFLDMGLNVSFVHCLSLFNQIVWESTSLQTFQPRYVLGKEVFLLARSSPECSPSTVTTAIAFSTWRSLSWSVTMCFFVQIRSWWHFLIPNKFLHLVYFWCILPEVTFQVTVNVGSQVFHLLLIKILEFYLEELFAVVVLLANTFINFRNFYFRHFLFENFFLFQNFLSDYQKWTNVNINVRVVMSFTTKDT